MLSRICLQQTSIDNLERSVVEMGAIEWVRVWVEAVAD